MKIEYNQEELSKIKIFLATPMYGGLCYSGYHQSMLGLYNECARRGVQLQSFNVCQESLVQRARNICCDAFMRTLETDNPFTHFMFIDADISFNPIDVINMAIICNKKGYDIVGGPYPKKNIAWEKIFRAANHDFMKQQIENKPELLKFFGGDYVFNFIKENNKQNTEFKLSEPHEVMELGTGFFMTTAEVMKKYRNYYRDKWYYSDHLRASNHDPNRKIQIFFDCEVDKKTQRYLSEDYYFCHKARKMGLKCWLLPWIKLTHTGTFMFNGDLSAIASIGAPSGPPPVKNSKETKEEVKQ